ncbi:hypothetical protein FGIG_09182 [Fasciola gigantica]|uniref:Uncharacterized protein n=1 Tax=Fasciola gigantica TaxID=46835 RepID=A0A504YZW0_FASGI|nr:hypothetical protein FGIG_09182 [Fasciola gigantica]
MPCAMDNTYSIHFAFLQRLMLANVCKHYALRLSVKLSCIIAVANECGHANSPSEDFKSPRNNRQCRKRKTFPEAAQILPLAILLEATVTEVQGRPDHNPLLLRSYLPRVFGSEEEAVVNGFRVTAAYRLVKQQKPGKQLRPLKVALSTTGAVETFAVHVHKLKRLDSTPGSTRVDTVSGASSILPEPCDILETSLRCGGNFVPPADRFQRPFRLLNPMEALSV